MCTLVTRGGDLGFVAVAPPAATLEPHVTYVLHGMCPMCAALCGVLRGWTGHSTPELLQGAQATLPALWSHPPSGVNDALRWAFYRGKISSVSSIGAVIHSQGLLLTCQATVQTSCDRLIAVHVPLAITPTPLLRVHGWAIHFSKQQQAATGGLGRSQPVALSCFKPRYCVCGRMVSCWCASL